MNLIENLLQTASEEAAEMAVKLSKANRFGLDSLDAKTEKPAHECIVAQHNDLLAVFELLRDRGVVFAGVGDPVAVGEAKRKIVESLELSQKAGTLVLSETDNAPVTAVGGVDDADSGLPTDEGDADQGTDPEDLTNTDAEEESDDDNKTDEESEEEESDDDDDDDDDSEEESDDDE